MEDFERAFIDQGYVVGGELVLRKKDCEALLGECHNRGYVILGLDFYRRKADGRVEELIGAGADFGSLADAANAVDRSFVEAKAVLDKTADEVELYSVVLRVPT